MKREYIVIIARIICDCLKFLNLINLLGFLFLKYINSKINNNGIIYKYLYIGLFEIDKRYEKITI
ncbi:protein of unknown function [Methanocaldococcus lauensis]|nr:protein of unknown function [Methanocaldococcus lauensis]